VQRACLVCAENRILAAPGWVCRGQRFFWENVGGEADMSPVREIEHRIKIYYSRAAYQNESRSCLHGGELLLAQEALVLRRDACNDKDQARKAKYILERRRFAA